MNNEALRDELRQTYNVDTLLKALPDPTTTYVALRRLKALGDARLGLEALVGAEDSRLHLLERRIDSMSVTVAIKAYYRNYDSFPFAAFTTAVSLATDREVGAFLRWKRGLLRPLYSVYLINRMTDVAYVNGTLINQTGDLLTVGVAGSIEAAEADLRRLNPDIIITDERLPGRSGEEGVRHLARLLPGARIVMTAQQPNDSTLLSAVKLAGGVGVIGTGPYFPAEYQRVLRAVLDLPLI